MNPTWMALLLADSSPCLRLHVLRELLHLPADDPEVLELSELRLQDERVRDLLALQNEDGSWSGGVLPGTGGNDALRATTHVLARLGYLGFDGSTAAVAAAAGFIFSQQRPDGSFPLPGDAEKEAEWGKSRYSNMPMQTALPLRSLALCGYARDAHAERAYDWLLAQRLEDGAFPVGMANGVYGSIAGYRRLAHSRWGCRCSTTAALQCLALHPERCSSPESRRALDLLLGRETREEQSLGFEVARLLGRETREEQSLGFEVARLVGAEALHGFISYYARFDLALLLDLCSRVGATTEDARVASLVQYVEGLQGAQGLWEYKARPGVARWLTFDLLRSFSRLEQGGDWFSLEAPTPFQPYPAKRKRY